MQVIPEYTPPLLAPPLNESELEACEKIRTIVIPVGPYRNLTTLLGAIFALHPEALVLNHAADRLLGAPKANFIARPDSEHKRHFLELAIRELQTGQRGWYGGSILKAHAFDSPEVKQAYHSRYGNSILKPNAKVLYWKDSMRIKLHLETQKTPISELFALGGICAVHPIRNPIHVARSNLRTGHWSQHVSPEQANFESVLKAILENLKWALTEPTLSQHLLLLWEDTFLDSGIIDLCKHVGLEPDPRWLDDIRSSVIIRSSKTEATDRSFFEDLVNQIFADLPGIRSRLLDFTL